jgi:hypothetical protein
LNSKEFQLLGDSNRCIRFAGGPRVTGPLFKELEPPGGSAARFPATDVWMLATTEWS